MLRNMPSQLETCEAPVPLMYTDGQTVNVPAVINERKVYLLNVLHTRNKMFLSSLL